VQHSRMPCPCAAAVCPVRSGRQTGSPGPSTFTWSWQKAPVAVATTQIQGPRPAGESGTLSPCRQIRHPATAIPLLSHTDTVIEGSRAIQALGSEAVRGSPSHPPNRTPQPPPSSSWLLLADASNSKPWGREAAA
jgi:hypothetical protein